MAPHVGCTLWKSTCIQLKGWKRTSVGQQRPEQKMKERGSNPGLHENGVDSARIKQITIPVLTIAASALSNVGLILSGMTLGYPSTVLPSLLSHSGSQFHVDIDQASWIASLSAITTPIGCLLAGPIIDRFGRRQGLQLLNIPFLIGWLLIAFWPTLPGLYTGRILTGFASGLATICPTIYTTEIVSHHLRTALVTLSPMMLALGILIIYFLGMVYQDQWQVVAGISAILTLISILLTPLLPESPIWLLTKNRCEDASRSMFILRGTSCEQSVQHEINTMKGKRDITYRRASSSWATTFTDLMQPEAYKPLFIMNLFFLFQQMAGVTIVIVYAVNFAKDAGVEQDTYIVALGIAIVRLLSTFITTWACNRYGRRPTAIYSGIGMSLSLLALTAHIYHNQHKVSPLKLAFSSFSNVSSQMNSSILNKTQLQDLSGTSFLFDWFAAITLLIYVLTSCIGFSTLPWAMLGEVFPTEVRGVAGGMTACFVYFISFLSVKFYPSIVLTIGKFNVFFLFASAAVFGTIFIEVYLPETHGKTLIEIEEQFRGKGQKRIESDEETETFS